MNKQQSQILDQCLSTDLVLDGAENIWNLPGYSKFVLNVGEFRGELDDISKYKMLQVSDVHGAQRYAELARIEMAGKSVKVRSAVQNYASDNNDTMLFQQVRYPESKLTHGRIQKSFTYAMTIQKKARAIIADLQPYNLTAAELDLYLESIKTAMEAHSQVNTLRKQRKVATKQLKRLFPEIRTTVATKLRTGATQFMETAPDFYNELIASFEINDYPTHYTEFDILTKEKHSGILIAGVKITATSAQGGTMEQFTNPVGEADFKQFKPTWWNITYECPGYEKLTMTAVKAERGAKLELVAEMVKI